MTFFIPMNLVNCLGGASWNWCTAEAVGLKVHPLEISYSAVVEPVPTSISGRLTILLPEWQKTVASRQYCLTTLPYNIALQYCSAAPRLSALSSASQWQLPVVSPPSIYQLRGPVLLLPTWRHAGPGLEREEDGRPPAVPLASCPPASARPACSHSPLGGAAARRRHGLEDDRKEFQKPDLFPPDTVG